MKINMPANIEFALERLVQCGYDAYAVGGCVRDALLGAVPKDWDITTAATPDEITEIFAGYKCLLHGEKYGTVAVLFGGDAVEITTFRSDGEYTDNRRPDTVRFSRYLRDDLSRRDFTINALAYRHDCGLIDHFGGRADLELGIVRCVGDARERFGEDALRILRALRFASVLSFRIDSHTAAAIHECGDRLNNIARERICAELTGILSGGGGSTAAVLNEFSDIIRTIVPELNGASAIWDQTIHAITNSHPEPIVRLVLILSWSSPDVETARRILQRLRFSNEIIDDVTVLLAHMGTAAVAPNAAAIKRLLSKLGERRLRLLLQAKRAMCAAGNGTEDEKIQQLGDINAAENRIAQIINDHDCYMLKDLKVNGNDLISIGFKPGKPLGAALVALLALVVEGDCPNERHALLVKAEGIFNNQYCTFIQ